MFILIISVSHRLISLKNERQEKNRSFRTQ